MTKDEMSTSYFSHLWLKSLTKGSARLSGNHLCDSDTQKCLKNQYNHDHHAAGAAFRQAVWQIK
jgi:hypothetical protein